MTNEELKNLIEKYDKETNKLFKENKELKSKLDKAIKLLKEDYFEDGSGNNVEEVIKILKGE